ncbi:MAG: RecX family transcriptional regulator [Longimonas sp.]|uniref:regulatory protein RecX n=1 Tax=Longimonas sp. TaxID=2039626 RepID=UPI00335365BF
MPTNATVTALSVQKNNPNRVSVFLDGDFALGIHQDLIVKYDLHTGRTLTPDEQAQLEADQRLIDAKQTALEYLAHKPRTEGEVRTRLQRDDYAPALIDDTIDRLHELDYLDDEAYAREYATNRFANKSYGHHRIRRELRDRGVAAPFINRALNQLEANVDFHSAARSLAEKYWHRVADEPHPLKQAQKLQGYLVRRGYATSTARAAVDAVQEAHSTP